MNLTEDTNIQTIAAGAPGQRLHCIRVHILIKLSLSSWVMREISLRMRGTNADSSKCPCEKKMQTQDRKGTISRSIIIESPQGKEPSGGKNWSLLLTIAC